MSFIRGARHRNGFPKPGDELIDLPSRHTRDGWVHMKDHESVYIDGKQYRHMREWSRPCAICNGPVSAFEKTGTVDANSRFSNRTCKDHRGLLPAFEKGFVAWSKDANAIVAGPRCGVGVATNTAPAIDGNEIATVKAERDEYAENVNNLSVIIGELRRKCDALTYENDVLKKKLAPHDLPLTMAAAQPAALPAPKLIGFPVAAQPAAFDLEKERAALLPGVRPPPKNKMPWE